MLIDVAWSCRPEKRRLATLFSQPIQAALYFRLENKAADEFTLAGKGDEKSTEQDGQQPLTGEKKHGYAGKKKHYAETVSKNYPNYRADRGRGHYLVVQVQPQKTIR